MGFDFFSVLLCPVGYFFFEFSWDEYFALFYEFLVSL